MTAITPSASRPFVPTYSKAPSACIESCGSDEPCDAAACPLPDAAPSSDEVAELLADRVDLLKLAVTIADETARSDIESHCREVNSGGHDWFDLCSVKDDDSLFVARADDYLRLRGDTAPQYRVVRNPAFPSLVRFEGLV